MTTTFRALLGATALCAVGSMAAAQDNVTLTIATVNNGDMIRMQQMTAPFTEANPEHPAGMGHAGGEHPARARHHRHRHQRRAV